MPKARRSRRLLGDDVLPRADLTGRQFGRLTVRAFAGRRPTQHNPSLRHAMWFCDCECGRTHCVRGDSMICGLARSCGCLRVETASRRRGKTACAFAGLEDARRYVEALDAVSAEHLRQAVMDRWDSLATDAKKPAPAEAEAGCRKPILQG